MQRRRKRGMTKQYSPWSFGTSSIQDLLRLREDSNSSDFGRLTEAASASSFSMQSTTMNALPHRYNDRFNYGLLLMLYILQGIPMGLSASIPFLIQQKLSSMKGENSNSYSANAIFALCSWPFSLKLFWAPIVDACFLRRFGRRKSWIVPVQCLAGSMLAIGSTWVERQLGLEDKLGTTMRDSSMNVHSVTAFFFFLYFLMATQDVAVDGWALTLLSPANRGRGPVCNSIGLNIGHFGSFVGFLALNDIESSERIRSLFGWTSRPTEGLVSLGTFLRTMGFAMLAITPIVACQKEALPVVVQQQQPTTPQQMEVLLPSDAKKECTEAELDASMIGLVETYRRLWTVCRLPAVQQLFRILLTYRLPTALADNVKFLKAVEMGMSKSTTALLSPTVILPLTIIVPIAANRVWHSQPLNGQFMTAYKYRVTIVPLLDCLLLWFLRQPTLKGRFLYWCVLVASTAAQTTVNSLQFNAQMTFFAQRVDPTLGGSYMTLLNTAANLGGTWPSSAVLWAMGLLTSKYGDPYIGLQVVLSVLGCVWISTFQPLVEHLASLPAEAWRTSLVYKEEEVDLEGNRPSFDRAPITVMSPGWPIRKPEQSSKGE